MAGGWSKDGAVQDQIDTSVDDAVKQARARLNQGESLHECIDCGEPIPEARRLALGGVRRCVGCQEIDDAENDDSGPINRRGSKDSQLR